MNYFFELLDSYRKRDCCVSRIDEGPEPIDPQRAQAAQAQLKSYADNFAANGIGKGQTLAGNNFTIKKAGQDSLGDYSIKIGRPSWPIKADGSWVVEKESKVKELISLIIGKPGQEGRTPAPMTAQAPVQAIPPQQPKKTPEEIRQEKEAAAELKRQEKKAAEDYRLELKEKIKQLATGLYEDLKKISDQKACKMELGYFLGITGNKENTKDYNPIDKKFVEDMYYLVYPQAGQKRSSPCKAKELIARNSKFRVYLRRAEETPDEHLARVASYNYSNVAITQLSQVFNVSDKSLRKMIKQCPKGKRGDECLKIETVSSEADDADLNAAKINLETYLNFLTGDEEITDLAEIKKLRNSIIFTRQGTILIKGTSLESMIMVDDGNRSLYDVLANRFQLKTGMSPKMMDLDNLPKDANKMASIRGKVDEHMPVIANLVQMRRKAIESNDLDLAEKIAVAVDTYVGRIENLCTYVQAIRQYLAGFEGKQYAISSSHLETYAFMKNETRNTKYCSDITKALSLAIGFASEKVEFMQADLVMQVGDDVGDGIRQDLAYVYNSKEGADNAAKRLGVSSEYVIPMKLSELLKISPDYRNAIPEELIGDPDREVYTILEGVKLESGTDTTYGSLSLGKLLASMLGNSNANQQDLQDRTRKGLGITRKNGYDIDQVEAYQREFAQDLLSYDEKIEKIQKQYTVTVKGKKVKETGALVVKSMLEELKKDMNYNEETSNAAISAGEALIKALEANKFNPKILEKLKKDFLLALKRERLFSFVADSFRMDEDGNLLNREKAAAAADILGRSGQSYKPMVTTINKASLKKGKARYYRIDHGEATTGCLAAALRGEASIQANSADSYGGIIVAYRDPNGLERRITFHYRNGSLSATGNMKNSEASKLPEMENASISRNHPLILETLKFLTGHLRQLSKLG